MSAWTGYCIITWWCYNQSTQGLLWWQELVHSASQAMASAEQLSASSPFNRNGYSSKTRSSSIDSNCSRSGAAESCARGSLNGKRLSDVCENHSMDGSQQPSPHQPRAQFSTEQTESLDTEQGADGSKGILGWIRRFTNLGRRTQSSIDMQVPPKIAADAFQPSVPRRSYSESELGPRRRAAVDIVRPSSEALGMATPHPPTICTSLLHPALLPHFHSVLWPSTARTWQDSLKGCGTTRVGLDSMLGPSF